MTPRRPPVRYHGSKFRIAAKIIEHFPAHRIYVEPFGGGAGVLMKKERSFAEVYNDLDTDIVNVFRVMQDLEKAVRLRRLVELTPWSRDEFMLTYEPADDPVERARRTIARSFMAFGSTSRRARGTGFRARAYRENHTEAMNWRDYPEQIVFFVDRLRGVTLENRDALEIIAQQDSPDTLFYCDPPYVLSSRSSIVRRGLSDSAYAHELTDDDHRRLAAVLRNVEGMVILSAYPSPLYDEELFPDWRRISFSARANGAVEREEVLWISPNAERRGRPLFSLREAAE